MFILAYIVLQKYCMGICITKYYMGIKHITKKGPTCQITQPVIKYHLLYNQSTSFQSFDSEVFPWLQLLSASEHVRPDHNVGAWGPRYPTFS